MLTIRPYSELDAIGAGWVIADTYGEFNLSFASPEEKGKLLGPFRHAHSTDPVHQAAIAHVIRAPIVLVAEEDGAIVGVLRGRKERLASLFVRGTCHRRGIGRRLVEMFEQESTALRVSTIRVAATLYGIPFYTAMGYRKTTGVRIGRSFEGTGLQYQPMKKVLPVP